MKAQLPAIALPSFIAGWDAVFGAARELFFYALLPLVGLRSLR